jgi:hypothetical protein
MIESPLIQELLAEQRHKDIEWVLTERFGTVQAEIMTALRPIQDAQKLDELVRWAVRCPDQEAFRNRLIAEENPS